MTTAPSAPASAPALCQGGGDPLEIEPFGTDVQQGRHSLSIRAGEGPAKAGRHVRWQALSSGRGVRLQADLSDLSKNDRDGAAAADRGAIGQRAGDVGLRARHRVGQGAAQRQACRNR